MQNSMVSFAVALRTVLSKAPGLPCETVSLEEGLGRVLAQALPARASLPPFDNSAMDGYAVISWDTEKASARRPTALRLAFEIPAGRLSQRRLRRGEAAKIMTGAPLPPGADAVIPVELAEERRGRVIVSEAVEPARNVRRAGEDLRAGERPIPAGTLLGPREITLLAACGHSRLQVSRRPVIGVLATGDELVSPGGPLPRGKIYNSNLYGLLASARKQGALARSLGTARDAPSDLVLRIRKGLEECDVLLTIAGVSVGEHDLVREALHRCGVKVSFSSVAMRPGKPFTFGTKGRKLVFGLPGNPVSSLLAFDLFVVPCLAKMSGRACPDCRERAVLLTPVEKKKGLRTFLKGIAEWREGKLLVQSAGPQGSGVLSSLAKANCLIVLPEEKTLLRRGEPVELQWL